MQKTSRHGIVANKRRVLCPAPDTIEIDQVRAADALDHLRKVVRVLTAHSFRIENTDQYSGALIGLYEIGIVGPGIVDEYQIRT